MTARLSFWRYGAKYEFQFECDRDAEMMREWFEYSSAATDVQMVLIKHRVHNDGEHNPQSKLTRGMVRSIRNHAAGGTSRTRLAQRYGVSLSCIDRVVTNQTWVGV